MTDVAMANEKIESKVKYSDLVYEAFISPIRSITVIDDDYPTIDQFLESQSSGDGVSEKKLQPNNINRLRKIIELCHRDKKWSIDVFDGHAPKLGSDESIPPHLNHSDLIVLDYHLDGSADIDDGSRARTIINELENNNHFNIIIVHTNGYDTGGIEKVYDEIIKDLFKMPQSSPFKPNDNTERKINEWLDEGNHDVILDLKLDLKEILKYMEMDQRSIVNFRKPDHLFNRYSADLNKLGESLILPESEIIKWVFEENYKSFQDKLLGKAKGQVRWEWDGDEKPNFIATGRVFISVIKKNNGSPQEELIDPLHRSLDKLNASPMHLLMAKMRSDIDDRGLEQANLIVADSMAQSGWLYNLLEKSSTNVIEHDKIIDLHWEQLARATKQELREFSKKIVESLKFDERWNGESKNVIKYFFDGCLKDPQITLGHLNSLSCSQPVLEEHLTTGSIIEVGDDLWVCLTPACDLVPKQRLGQWKDRIGEQHLVFKAAKLFGGVTLNTANENANLNEYIYLNIKGEPKAFTLNNGGKNGNPEWEVFYADNQGVFGSRKELELVCVRKNEAPDENGLPLTVEKFTANVVAELRYEYALNLMHKFGANQTRVGLGFVDKSGFF
ncbi:response regulator receiver domain [Vibrio diabolicus]|uniref:response regulator receiver domain n=1 Tax=Vibrio diabolicus TaxID=50719 RepID=UPI001592CCE0|nr:response regulator receiver domain [Vibrio diabolicus]NVC52575.1 hypothetical protein [Vibrio diabolicus]